MRGLMQDVPLTIELVLRRLGRHAGSRTVVTGTSGEPVRMTWAEVGERAGMLRAPGVEPDDPAAQERFVDGWLRTGDLARIDPDGSVEIVDRAKDLVKSGGEWISSVELEYAITAHPDVVEAAVIAIPHPKWDERPLALVVARQGASLDDAELRDFLSRRVAKWWIPDEFELVDALPRTAVGKLDKKLLRERHGQRTANSV